MTSRICEQLGIDFPLFAFSHCRDVVAAVTNAGGFGVLGATAYTPEQLDRELAWIDDHVGGRPYGADIIVPAKFEGKGENLSNTQLADRIPADFDDDRERLVARVYDLDASSRFLCMRPEVDCDRLGLLGFSHGASTVMLGQHWELGRALDDYAVGEGAELDILVRSPPPGAPDFAVAVAYYPGCGLESVVHFSLDTSELDDLYFPATDLYIEHGDADPLVRVQGGAMSAELIPKARLRVIRGMGHDFPAQLVPTLASAIRSHLTHADATA